MKYKFDLNKCALIFLFFALPEISVLSYLVCYERKTGIRGKKSFSDE